MSPTNANDVFTMLEATKGDWEEAGTERLTYAELFSCRARSVPDVTAIVDGDREISFRDLDALSSIWAHRLADSGVGPEIVIGVFGNRSFRYAAAIVAVLKTGGCYVPLDPTYPAEALQFMLRDSGASLIVTLETSPEVEAYASTAGIKVVHADGIPDNRGDFSLDRRIAAESIAAIVYSSGSEAVRKGVAIPHRSIMARVRQAAASPRPEVVCQLAPVGVIGHVSDLLVPLVLGSKVFVIGPDAARSIAKLARAIGGSGAKQISLVPSLLRAIAKDDLASQEMRKLERIIVSGESITAEVIDLCRRRLPGTVIINAYGLTETTGIVSHAEIVDGHDISVGRSNSVALMSVVDDDLEEVGPGITGRILVTGPQVAGGYIDRDRELSASFVAGLHGRRGHSFLTGDLGRSRADGTIVLVGRADREVNVRGIRINLDALEQELESEADVERAVVVLDSRSPSKVLRAYIVPVSGVAFDPEALRRRMSGRLPPAFVPASLHCLDQLPLLPNGKIDRQELACRSILERAPLLAAADAGGPLSAKLREICRDVLESNEFDLNDRFLDFTDSLALMQIIGLIEETFGVSLTFDDLLDAATVSGLEQVLADSIDATIKRAVDA